MTLDESYGRVSVRCHNDTGGDGHADADRERVARSTPTGPQERRSRTAARDAAELMLARKSGQTPIARWQDASRDAREHGFPIPTNKTCSIRRHENRCKWCQRRIGQSIRFGNEAACRRGTSRAIRARPTTVSARLRDDSEDYKPARSLEGLVRVSDRLLIITDRIPPPPRTRKSGGRKSRHRRGREGWRQDMS